MRRRLYAAVIHFAVSATFAVGAAILVFVLWFPGPYRHISGGTQLFILVAGIDVVLGPLLTLAVFDVKKSRWHLSVDLAFIGVVQVIALGYGLHTGYEARPVAVVFEKDRFRVITAASVYEAELDKAPREYQRLPMAGPWILGTREPKTAEERSDVLFKGLGGIDTAQRPSYWQPYRESMAQAVAASRPIDVLLNRYPAREAEFRAALIDMKADPATARFLPLVARGDWVMVIDHHGAIFGSLRADAFF